MSNLGFGPSQRHVRSLNEQEEKSSSFRCSFDHIYETMKTQVSVHLNEAETVAFSLAIDATKVAQII